MRILGISFYAFIIGLVLIFSSCEEEPLPVIPDPDNPIVEKPILPPPPSIYFDFRISQNLLCPGQTSQISLRDGKNQVMDPRDFTFFLSPAIGSVDKEKGVYQAPANLDSAVTVALWAVYKTDTAYKKGKFLRVVPSDPDSKVLRDFYGISSAVDTKQLPDGNLVFATNSPSDPAGIFPYSEFEIFSTDQQGQLLWKNNLGKGILRRLIIGKEVIYGLGYLEEFVAVKFDFKGNHLGTYSLELGSERNYQVLENLKGAVDEQDELFFAYGTYDLKWLNKMDSEGKVGDPQPINFFVKEFFVLENSKLLFTPEGISNGFVVTDLDLKVLWNMNSGVKTRKIQVGNSQEIWSISGTGTRFEYLLNRFDPNGKQISSKLVRLNEGVSFYNFYDLVQLPNQSVWLVGSGLMNAIQPPLYDEVFRFRFYLINISSEGENLNEVPIESITFQVPYLPGGWPTNFHGLFQGSAGLILAGHWFYNFLIQLGPNYTYSHCQSGS